MLESGKAVTPFVAIDITQKGHKKCARRVNFTEEALTSGCKVSPSFAGAETLCHVGLTGAGPTSLTSLILLSVAEGLGFIFAGIRADLVSSYERAR